MLKKCLVWAVVVFATIGSVPGPGQPSLTIVEVVDSPDTELGMVVRGDTGEQFLLLTAKDAEGRIVGVTGGGYIAPSGEALVFWYGDDGRPEYMFADGWVFHFRNYNSTQSTVDITGQAPDGTVHEFPGVNVDMAPLADAEELASYGVLGTATTQARRAAKLAEDNSLDGPGLKFGLEMATAALKATAFVTSWTGCAMGVATTAMMPVGGAAVAAVSCTSALLGTIGTITGNEWFEGAAMMLDTYACTVLQDSWSCGTLALNVLADTAEAAAQEIPGESGCGADSGCGDVPASEAGFGASELDVVDSTVVSAGAAMYDFTGDDRFQRYNAPPEEGQGGGGCPEWRTCDIQCGEFRRTLTLPEGCSNWRVAIVNEVPLGTATILIDGVDVGCDFTSPVSSSICVYSSSNHGGATYPPGTGIVWLSNSASSGRFLKTRIKFSGCSICYSCTCDYRCNCN